MFTATPVDRFTTNHAIILLEEIKDMKNRLLKNPLNDKGHF